jgi:hypothetical protein
MRKTSVVVVVLRSLQPPLSFPPPCTLLRWRAHANTCPLRVRFSTPVQQTAGTPPATMREIVHLQVGQCGNQIGAKFWEVSTLVLVGRCTPPLPAPPPLPPSLRSTCACEPFLAIRRVLEQGICPPTDVGGQCARRVAVLAGVRGGRRRAAPAVYTCSRASRCVSCAPASPTPARGSSRTTPPKDGHKEEGGFGGLTLQNPHVTRREGGGIAPARTRAWVRNTASGVLAARTHGLVVVWVGGSVWVLWRPHSRHLSTPCLVHLPTHCLPHKHKPSFSPAHPPNTRRSPHVGHRR